MSAQPPPPSAAGLATANLPDGAPVPDVVEHMPADSVPEVDMSRNFDLKDVDMLDLPPEQASTPIAQATTTIQQAASTSTTNPPAQTTTTSTPTPVGTSAPSPAAAPPARVPTPMRNTNAAATATATNGDTERTGSRAASAHPDPGFTMPSEAPPHGAPVRQYINTKVTGVLLEGMRLVAREQPKDPLRVLGEYLIARSKELEGPSV